MGSFARVSVILVALSGLLPGTASPQGGSRASGSGSAPSPQSAAEGRVLPVVTFVEWRDPREGAFTMSVPHSWSVTGGTFRRSAVDITHAVRAHTADDRVQIFVNDPDIVPREVPNRLTAMAGQREGQVVQGAWGGPVLLARFQSGQQFAQTYIAQRVCRAAEFTGGGALQRESNDMNVQVAPYARASGSRAQATVGEVYFRCGEGYGYATATTLIAGPAQGPGAVMWFVYAISGFTAKKVVDTTFAMYVLHTMTSSVHIDPQWQARSEGQARALTSSVTRMQNSMAANLRQQAAARAGQERSRVVRGNNVDVMSGWEARNKTRDAAMRRGDEARRGVTVTEDPVWGSRTVSNNYNYYWTRPDGSIAGTTTTTPPNYSDGWRLMSTH
jgi:hypothetical protein